MNFVPMEAWSNGLSIKHLNASKKRHQICENSHSTFNEL